MDIDITFKPVSGNIVFKTKAVEKLAPGDRHPAIETRTLDASPKDNWCVSVSLIKMNGKMYILKGTCISINGRGKNWPLWLSMYMPEEFISTVETLTSEWFKEWESWRKQPGTSTREAIVKSYNTTIDIPANQLVLEEAQ